MIDPRIGSVSIAIVLILDGLLAVARSAIVNSRGPRLKHGRGRGLVGATLAARAASDGPRMILSLRLGQSLLRLLAVGIALVAFLPALAGGDGAAVVAVVGVLLGSGLLIGLVEFGAENIALRTPARWSRILAPLVTLVVTVLSPLGWAMARLASWIAPSSGDHQPVPVTEEEIMTLVDAGEEGGMIEEDEKAMIYSIFQLGDTLAREVMVPRIDILAFEESTSLVEATETMLRTGYSRAPVYSGSIDNIVGLLYVKDLLAAWSEGAQDRSVAALVREAYFVPEAKKIDDLLAEMQALRVQMAIVVDEYGGTAGLVTFEDIVEEIVGEIQDEYDVGEELPFQQVQEGEYIFSGGIDLDDVNELTGAQLPKDTSETLGGFIYSQLGRVPSPGEVVEAGGLHLVVDQVTGRRIRKVRARRTERPPEEAHSDANHTRTA